MAGTFVYTWNPAFLATPADTEDADLGAERIRDTKAAVGERLAINHSLNGDTNDGKHVYVDLLAQAVSSGGTLYPWQPLDSGDGAVFAAADAGGTTQLYYIDSNGVVIQLTSAGAIAAVSPIPSGTRSFFQQAAAPSGWVLDNTITDQVIRVNTGTPFGAGGSWTITGATVGNTTLTTDQIPAHTHGVPNVPTTFSASMGAFQGSSNGYISGVATSYNTGGSQPHSHGFTNDGTWRPAYIDCIVAVKS